MFKDIDDKPIEPSRKKAERKWSNNFVQMQFKKAKKEEAERAAKEAGNQPPAIAESITNKKPDGRGSVIRAQTKFAKDIRQMMEGHSSKVLALYAVSLRAQRKRLLREKLRRLEARQTLRDSWGS
jgi:hypothetical protein